MITNCLKRRGDATRCSNYRGLKFLENTIKVLECIVDAIIRQQVDIDGMQFGSMLGCTTADAIFIFKKMQQKHQLKRKTMYAAFVDLEKIFDRVPRKVLWFSLRKLEVDEWVICFAEAKHSNALLSVQMTGSF